MLNFGIVVNALLLVLGILWCHAMFGRWRNDLAEFRASKDSTDRAVIATLWIVTALVVVAICNFLVGILRNLGVL